ncbi:hypothetical protein NHX12_012711 [Muraenolepis orangiensis]|uniref:Uncharacterized protein n=1 Tax=Muraenolepis orangiensis TaxID=630683 RepID=A0A9Q0DDD5_9TELE|nr:hypothetical protein NHX12_012711 [Muraenolepis orangiensis]
MPVETLYPSAGGVSFRLLNKGPAYFRRPPAERGLSAVERLEADKAKYVKSQQVVLTRPALLKPPPPSARPPAPIIRKPLLTPAARGQIATPPARKVPRRPIAAETGVGGVSPVLNLQILNNLINNPLNTSSSKPLNTSSPLSSSKPLNTSSSKPINNFSSKLLNTSSSISSSKPLNTSSSLSSSSKPLNTSSSLSSSSTSSPLNNRNNNNLPPPVPARAPRVATPPHPHPHPHPTAVRRVEVRPHGALGAFSPRPALPLPSRTALPRAPPPGTSSSPSPPPSSGRAPRTPPPPYPPPSPAFTGLSGASSRGSPRGSARGSPRGPPALHRSKSDLSERRSRGSAHPDRFFTYCGLPPGEVEALGGTERFGRASSDIVSVSKLRSVSSPSSERDEGEGEGEEPGGGGGEGEGPARGGERVPYGISVIERNARVIKWLYSIKQARDAAQV